MLKGRSLLNADGTIDTASMGYQYAISTLTEIKQGIIEQKFYEVAPADFLPVDVGQSAWNDEIVQNVSFQSGGSFYQGDVDTVEGNGNLASVGASMGNVRIPISTWAKHFTYTTFELEKALQSGNWDPIDAKMRSLKKNWDLGIQETAFLGHPAVATMSGLLNNSEVNINTVLITESISDMDATEFSAFVRGVLSAYSANAQKTAMPDTLVVPLSDYLGLGDLVPVSGGVTQISKLEFLLNMFKKMTRNEGFEILPLAYAESDFNASRGITKNRYVLYRKDPDTLAMNVPVDFTMVPVGTTNNIMFSQGAYGQYSGVLIPRIREVLYFDETSTT